MKSKDFLKSQKIMRLATIDPKGSPHIVPVWYDYSRGKFYVGTNTSTKKAKNIKQNSKISFCVDVGVSSPDIFGIMAVGKARLILEKKHVQLIAKRILLRYFKSLRNKSAQQLLNDTDCIIEITPKRIKTWKF
ncbi:MAG: pyridoxamine 5'-phosphate oxidase family protein [Thaumarchaeota archaeon]|nr:MAG: pyridoxamine 5'-phosphate oxidase [Thaumarchaeota archaeon 13_1_40CM_4_38_7]OLD40893.1 MAG: pyridoxamine 5'-phosphate oxidase [Thaumarchaeota archaeon 13_1_40CM_2_39_4]TLY03712.1 MAG: pyridoxamine 5'-phosphate oxidase family protein [Nitrososphaerota archaeon]